MMTYVDRVHALNFPRQEVDSDTQAAFSTSAQYFPTPLQAFQYYDKYARFDWQKGRRETWVETVDRAVSFLEELVPGKLTKAEVKSIRSGILNMEVMPSMRLLAMAGDAARRNHIALYNCTAHAIDSLDSFHETLLILMAGAGVGYSVEKQFVNKLPKVGHQKHEGLPPIYVIPDTTEGWGEALRLGINAWFGGEDLVFDYSNIRPAGSILRTKGGRASGHEPLKRLLDFARETILEAQGRRLRPIEVHDIMCMIGDCVVSGGVRRSSLISLFDLDDNEMLFAKSGDFPDYRWNANNSAVITKPESWREFEHIVHAMDGSQRGEPGVFSRYAANLSRPERRKRDEFLTNPCGEILLRHTGQMCNLSSVVCRPEDTLETLQRKVRLATIIGTIQATATDFPGLRPIWKQNCEEERLLGVDLNGQMDSPLAQSPTVQRILREVAIETNVEFADRFGINRSAAVTCTKPSGNSSTLVDTSSGIHPRWSKYYIRRARVSASSPLYRVLRDAGVPMKPENGQKAETARTWVVSFLVKSRNGSIFRGDRTAREQMNYWRQVKSQWAEHSISCTVTYKPHEVNDITTFLYQNQPIINGLSFLPHSDALYDQAPYEEITAEEYARLAASFPEIDFSRIAVYEAEDMTTVAQEVACVGGLCDFNPAVPEFVVAAD